MVEDKIFKEALNFLKENYDTDWKQLSEQLPTVINKYKTELWSDLIIVIIDHLERKEKYYKEKQQGA